MDRLFAMQCFVRVVEAGSFSAVARELETTQPVVSKQIAALERHLRSKLLNRTTRTLSLTEAGERYYAHCRGIVDALEEAESSVREAQRSLAGALRVAAPVAFGRLMLVPRLGRFLDAHPQLTLDLRLNDRFIDLVEEGIDVAIRIGEPAQANLTAHPLGITRRVAIAAPAYLARCGEPQTPQALRDHNCIVYTGITAPHLWSFECDGREQTVHVRGNLHCNSSEAVREAVLAGLGIALSPSWLFGSELTKKTLRVLLPHCRAKPMPIHALTSKTRRPAAKVRAFLDFLVGDYGDDPFLCASAPKDHDSAR